MSDLAFNIWGVVGGVVFAIIPALLMWIRARLPSRNLPYLLDLLKETQELFSTALREGLLTDDRESHQINLNICYANIQVDSIRAEVYDSETWTDDLKRWWQGLTGKIFTVYYGLNVTRVRLARITSKGRKLRASQGHVSGVTMLSEDLKGNLQDDSSSAQNTTPQHLCIPHAPAPQLCPVVGDATPLAHNVSAGRDPDCATINGHRYSTTEVDVCPLCCHDPKRVGQPSLVVPPLRHTVLCDADLQDLLSLALLHPLPQPHSGKRERAMRRSVLVRFGKKLCESDCTVGVSDGAADLERYSKALSRLSSRAEGLGERSHDEDGTQDPVAPDKGT